jgi:hypothetical protein
MIHPVYGWRTVISYLQHEQFDHIPYWVFICVRLIWLSHNGHFCVCSHSQDLLSRRSIKRKRLSENQLGKDNMCHLFAAVRILSDHWLTVATFGNSVCLVHWRRRLAVTPYQRFQNCAAAPPGGAVDLFWIKYRRKVKCIFWYALWLVEIFFTYHVIPVLAPNYKHNILLPSNVRKVCY